MKKEIRAKLHEILDACIDSKTDVWFEYSPHIKAIRVNRTDTKHWSKKSHTIDTEILFHDKKLNSPIERYDEIIERIKGYDE